MSYAGTETEFDHREKVFREKFPCPVIPTNLKGAYSVPAPREDFDPNTASADELIKNGVFWRRPDATEQPSLARAWQRVFSRKWLANDRIVPELEPQVGRTHQLRKPLRQATDQNFLVGTWSGAGIRGGGPWQGCLGIWKIPTVSQPSQPQGQEGGWKSCSWVGIDGFDLGDIVSNDVLQAGVEQNVDSQGRASYYVWFEWFAPPQQGSPSYIWQTNVTNFAVSPGHQVQLHPVLWGFMPLGIDGVPGVVGVIAFVNETTSKNFTAPLLAPPGATASGNTVEWIMEAPDGGEPTSSLPKFTPVVFSSAVASKAGEPTAGNPQNGDTVNIENAAGKILTSVAVGNETVTIDFIG